MKEFKSIASVIKTILPVSKDPPAVEHLQQSLIDYWRTQVGMVALHSHPLLFQSGRLVVFCDSAAWATQLRYQTPSLLLQLNDNNFKISNISIKIRPASSFRPPADYVAKKIEPISKENAKALCELAEKVEHSGLKKSLLRLSKKTATKNHTKTDT